MSGCLRTSKNGTSTNAVSFNRSGSSRRFVRNSTRYHATSKITTILTNSDTCTLCPPTTSHRRAPKIRFPKKIVTSSRKMLIPYK